MTPRRKESYSSPLQKYFGNTGVAPRRRTVAAAWGRSSPVETLDLQLRHSFSEANYQPVWIVRRIKEWRLTIQLKVCDVERLSSVFNFQCQHSSRQKKRDKIRDYDGPGRDQKTVEQPQTHSGTKQHVHSEADILHPPVTYGLCHLWNKGNCSQEAGKIADDFRHAM